VQGPADLQIELGRNHSFNTTVAAVMLDLADEMPPPYYCAPQEWLRDYNARSDTCESDQSYSKAVAQNAASEPADDALIEDTELLRVRDPVAWASQVALYDQLALRRSPQGSAGKNDDVLRGRALADTCRFAMSDQSLNDAGIKTARDLEMGLKWNGKESATYGYGNRRAVFYASKCNSARFAG